MTVVNSQFSVNGSVPTDAVAVAPGSVVALQILDTTGISGVVWSVVGNDNIVRANPAITASGHVGAVATFTMPADIGDALGQSYRVECAVSDGGSPPNKSTTRAIIGVANPVGIVPFASGEDLDRDPIYGWTMAINKAITFTVPTPNPVPTILTYAGGCIGWWDSDYSQGIADGASIVACTNRIQGSSAVLAPVAGGTTSVYQANGWNCTVPESCWRLIDAALRATGADVTAAGNGLGKNWTYVLVWRPAMTLRTTQYAGGFDKLGAASFNKSSGITIRHSTDMSWKTTSNTTEVADSALIAQNAQILQVSRLNGNQIRVATNNVHTAPQSFGSGVTYDIDGFTIGGWISSLISGDCVLRAAFLFNKDVPPDFTDSADLYRYLVRAYGGFENTATLR